MNQETKIDLILSKVSNIETHIAIIEEKDRTMIERVEHGEGRIEKVETITQLFKVERANILFVMKWLGISLGTVATFVTLFILIANYIQHQK